MTTNADAKRPPAIEVLERLVDEAIRLLTKEVLPTLQPHVLYGIDFIFTPRMIAKQIIWTIYLEMGMVVTTTALEMMNSFLSNFNTNACLIRALELQQQHVSNRDEWMEIAERIDVIQGNDKWRSEPECPMYEQDRIAARIDTLVHLIRRQDVFELMFVLRGSLGRNAFGLLHEGLFTKAKAGTKVLVETYHNVVCSALDYCCDAPASAASPDIPTDARLAFFNETRHAYGRTAMILSGGAALGFYHVGVAKGLMENGLMPRVLGGSSAGSIVCAILATRTDEELLNDLFQVRGTHAPGHSGRLRYDFFRPIGDASRTNNSNNNHNGRRASWQSSSTYDPTRQQQQSNGAFGAIKEAYNNSSGFFHDAKLTFQGLMPIPVRHITSVLYDVITGSRRPTEILQHDVNHIRDVLRDDIGNFTFQEAFDRTGRILNIVVTPTNRSDPPRLLNYLTSPHVLIWSAALASASLPGVFEANRLVMKEANGYERYESVGEKGLHFRDGSMETDLPMEQLAEMFNVNHFIISQANPHGLMFGSYKRKGSIWHNPIHAILDSILTFMKSQIKYWVMNVMDCVNRTRLAPMVETSRMLLSASAFFTQEYQGRPQDISLIPWIHHRGLFSAIMHLIYNPSEDEFREWIEAAERETWRLIPAIKSHIAEEITLDRCVQRLRRRVVLESWEKQHTTVQQSSSTSAKKSGMGNGVPSFFQSPSLVNLGGLGIADQANLEVHVGSGSTATSITTTSGQHQHHYPHPNDMTAIALRESSTHALSPAGDYAININSGWAGLGLRGNRSSGNLHRSTSDASGLFIDDADAAQQQHQQQFPNSASTSSSTSHGGQVAGEQTTVEQPSSSKPTTSSRSATNLHENGGGHHHQNVAGGGGGMDIGKGYLKTTSMAKFYYRKSPSGGYLNDQDGGGTSEGDNHNQWT